MVSIDFWAIGNSKDLLSFYCIRKSYW